MATKAYVAAIFISVLITTSAFATIWIVDNNPDPSGGYTTLSAAHAIAMSGDTIYVYPSVTAYAGITVTKQLYIFGTGFDLNIYGGQATTAGSEISGTMKFDPGSGGSFLEGFGGGFTADINVGNIIVKRNDLSKVDIGGSNCQILQNEIIGTAEPGVVTMSGNLGNVIIANNKIINTSSQGTTWARWALNCEPSSIITVVNNVLRANSAQRAIEGLGATSVAQNNIIIDGITTGDGVFQYNMSHSTLPAGTGNIENMDMSIVFENPADYTTGLHLLPGSPASGTGYGGTDMGIYGGDAPYVDGGHPGIPAIFHIESEVVTTPQNGLDVLFKAKSNRE
ncbi:MAG: hypothetical protein HUU32_16860 [Calditrichaceae bacterium]|nr:hypothetical protein [Calditrichia bacterium]NUQ43062.1 hypothetical protein [Calditrichaceae bacterium]